MTAGGSDRGDRQDQEDGWLAERHDDVVLCAVCDGMGSMVSGRAAADLALSMLQTALRSGASPTAVLEQLPVANSDILARADRARRREPGCDPGWLGRGSTAEVAVFTAGSAHLAHVGDGSIYRLRAGKLEELTTPHTLLNEYCRVQPQATEAELQALPANVIVRALGMRDDIEIDRIVMRTCPGDVFLLCSDGVTAYLDEDAIATLLRQREAPSVLVRAVLAAAATSCTRNRSRDNATAVIHVVVG